ncbi:unnamed protein product [Sphagnum troendelagicum]|uniref:Asymmetric leaves 1 n=1 Tax=Sphagnum jensenii TaxID=128206 RepID=A0ABP1A1X6_9BRYO
MKERQRWQAEEDNVLREYVKQYGPRDWHLVSERMGTTLDRDAKSCVERWKNYLKPDIKKGSLTEEEQQLVISLQAKYGNKWKKIAAEVPGRTAKRLGKWWEAYKDKQQKEKEKDRPRFAASGSTGETSNYSEMLATLADKFGQQQQQQGSTMLPHPTFPTASLLGPPPVVPLALLGPSMAGGTANPTSVGILIPKLPSFEMLPSHPLVTVAFPVPALWAAANLQQTRQIGPSAVPMPVPEMALSASHWVQLLQFCKELEDRHQYWFAQKKESSWRLKRLEAKLEAEKMQQRKQKMEDVNASIATLRKEESQFLEGLEADYKEKILSLHREEERKDAKLVEMWTAKHMQLSQFLQQMLHEAPPSAPSQTHSGPGPSEQP